MAEPRPVPELSAADVRRFWSKVDRPSGVQCWTWTAYVHPRGYARFSIGGFYYAAHRVAYAISVGAIPAGLVLDHLCRNRACVNPAHLEVVTVRENTVRGLRSYALRTRCQSGRHDITDPTNVTTQKGGSRLTCLPCLRESRKRRKARAAAKARAKRTDAA